MIAVPLASVLSVRVSLMVRTAQVTRAALGLVLEMTHRAILTAAAPSASAPRGAGAPRTCACEVIGYRLDVLLRSLCPESRHVGVVLVRDGVRNPPGQVGRIPPASCTRQVGRRPWPSPSST